MRAITVILLASMAVGLITTGTAFAPHNTNDTHYIITVKTNDNTYHEKETMTISGRILEKYCDAPITLIINAPDGNSVYIDQLDIDQNGRFSTNISTGSPLWRMSGTYTIEAFHNCYAHNETTFNYQSTEIKGNAYQDTNKNGTFDAGEPGVPNRTIIAVSTADFDNVSTTKTDGLGSYSFKLEPGGYLVQIIGGGPQGYSYVDIARGQVLILNLIP